MKPQKASIARSLCVLLLIAFMLPQPGTAKTGAPASKPQHKAIDPSLAKTVTAAMFEHKKKKIFLVDVRPAAEFNRYHIPGALNIPLHAVRTKAFLKTKTVVLVNDGYEVGALADACRALREKGFRVVVMAGGLCAWKVGGGTLTGDPFAQREMNRITAIQFQRERAFGHHKVVHLWDTLADTPAAGKAAVAPGAERMPLAKPEKALSRIKSWIKAKNASPFTRIVVMTDTGKENRRIQRWLADAGLHRQVYLLKGGLQAYQKQLAFNRLARKSKRERRKSIGGCQTCQQEQ